MRRCRLATATLVRSRTLERGRRIAFSVYVSGTVSSVAHREFNGGGRPQRDLRSTRTDRGARAVERAARHLACPEARSVEPGLQHRRISRTERAGRSSNCSSARCARSSPKPTRCACASWTTPTGRGRSSARRPSGRFLSSMSAPRRDPRAAALKPGCRPIWRSRSNRPAARCSDLRCSRPRADRFFWYARYHHIVMDGYGMWLVARRVAEIYSELCAGRAAHGAGVRIALRADRAGRRRTARRSRRARPAILARCSGRPSRIGQPQPERAVPRPARKAFFAAPHHLDGSSGRAASFGRAARGHEPAAGARRCGRDFPASACTGSTDVVIGMPVAARDAVARGIPGMASNVLPVRLSVHARHDGGGGHRGSVATNSKCVRAPTLSARRPAARCRGDGRGPRAVWAQPECDAVQL